MKRLVEGSDPALGALRRLVEGAERYEPAPFAKRAMKSRLSRALDAGGARRLALRPGLIGAVGLLIAATAAAAGYSALAPSAEPAQNSPARVAPRLSQAKTPPALVAPRTAPSSVAPSPAPAPALDDAAPESPAEVSPPSPRRAGEKPRAGEDPTQVAEAVRALRKQGNFARAQALLAAYLKNNPHGALAEDALALSIEAAAARKDPRAADYARRYLARYPSGRFRAVAERALSR